MSNAKPPSHCTFPGCCRPKRTRELCHAHYQQRQRGEEPRALTNRRKASGPIYCEHCAPAQVPVYARDCCHKHYQRLLTYGDPTFTKKAQRNAAE